MLRKQVVGTRECVCVCVCVCVYVSMCVCACMCLGVGFGKLGRVHKEERMQNILAGKEKVFCHMETRLQM